jgi:hypothetical protein
MRIIPVDWPTVVGEGSAKFAVRGVSLGQHTGPTAINLSFLGRCLRSFIHVFPQLSCRCWLDPVPNPPLLRKSGRAGNRTRNLLNCSQKLWLLDHRGGNNNNNNNNCVAFSPQANYTDWTTTIGRRILVPTFANRVVLRGQRGGSSRPLISVL